MRFWAGAARGRNTNRVFQYIVIHIKVGGVRRRADVRNVRGFSAADVLPVNAREEGVLLKFLDAVLAQPALPAADQPLHQVLGVLGYVRDVRWELKALLESSKNVL